LGQDVDEEAKQDRPCLAEPKMVVISAVTRVAISQAVEQLAVSGYFGHLRPLTSDAENGVHR
jgi:hypothetical protein